MCSVLILSILLVGVVGAVPRFSLQPRIVNGTDTTIEQHPYQVRGLSSNRPHKSSCWIKLQRERDGFLHDVIDRKGHEKYDHSTSDYDVAVIKVAKPFQFSEAVKPISMITETPPVASEVVVTGWGFIDLNRTMPKQLQEVHMNIVDKTEYGVTDRMLCAFAGVSKGFCGGDSGGPLVFNDKVAGIVSWVIYDCAYLYYPDVFTDVANIRNWVTKHTDVESST